MALYEDLNALFLWRMRSKKHRFRCPNTFAVKKNKNRSLLPPSDPPITGNTFFGTVVLRPLMVVLGSSCMFVAFVSAIFSWVDGEQQNTFETLEDPKDGGIVCGFSDLA